MSLTQEKINSIVLQIRNKAALFLIDTAQWKKRVGETVIYGASTPVYNDPIAIACRLIVRSGSSTENIAAQPRQIQQNTFVGLYKMQVPFDLDIQEGDQVLYTDKSSNHVKTLDVLYVPARNMYMGAFVITLQEVK